LFTPPVHTVCSHCQFREPTVTWSNRAHERKVVISDMSLGKVVLWLAEEAPLEEVARIVAKLQPLLRRTKNPCTDSECQTELLAFYHSDVVDGGAWAALATPELLERQAGTAPSSPLCFTALLLRPFTVPSSGLSLPIASQAGTSRAVVSSGMRALKPVSQDLKDVEEGRATKGGSTFSLKLPSFQSDSRKA